MIQYQYSRELALSTGSWVWMDTTCCGYETNAKLPGVRDPLELGSLNHLELWANEHLFSFCKQEASTSTQNIVHVLLSPKAAQPINFNRRDTSLPAQNKQTSWMEYNENLSQIWAGAARTRTPSITNYDVHSPTWGDGRPGPPPSAMRAPDLGHEPSCSPIDPVQIGRAHV